MNKLELLSTRKVLHDKLRDYQKYKNQLNKIDSKFRKLILESFNNYRLVDLTKTTDKYYAYDHKSVSFKEVDHNCEVLAINIDGVNYCIPNINLKERVYKLIIENTRLVEGVIIVFLKLHEDVIINYYLDAN